MPNALASPCARSQGKKRRKVNRHRSRCRDGTETYVHNQQLASHASGSASLARLIACGRPRRARARAAHPAADGRRGTGRNAATEASKGRSRAKPAGLSYLMSLARQMQRPRWPLAQQRGHSSVMN
jgi:hypothetical protein